VTVASHKETDDDRGAVLVEFALIVPILVILLVGIIEFGRAYNLQITLQGAAREGARALALGQDPAAAVNAAAAGVGSVIVTSTGCPTGNPAGSYATVTAQRAFSFSIPLVPIEPGNLSATASMRCGL
jgi:Flp pilus assembly protein TadG